MRPYSGRAMVGLARALFAVLLAALAMTLPGAASARDSGFAPGSVCLAVPQAGEDLAALALAPQRWNCNHTTWPTSAGRVLVRYDRSHEPTVAKQLRVPRQRFVSLEAIQLGNDGEILTRHHWQEADLPAGRVLAEMLVPLDKAQRAPAAVVIAMSGPTFPGRLAQAKAFGRAESPPVAGIEHLLAALLCGLLLAPAIFDLGFFRTLRRRFPLYHAAFCVLAGVQTASVTGLIQLLTPLSLDALGMIARISFDLMVACSVLFLATFLEPGVLTRGQRRALHALAGCAVLLGVLMSAGVELLGTRAALAYYAGYGVFLAALLWLVAQAWRAGSRAVRYMVLAYAPLLLVGAWRIAAALGSGMQTPFAGVWHQSLALAFEVVVTSFAVADRFMIIKRERDRARHDALVLEELTERDVLTGLLNRRALEARFAGLFAQGFTTLALIDLDHFKLVNDRYGHKAGDAVLCCTGRALQRPDENTVAFRIGGEEFVVLLRGDNVLERAEDLRRAIAVTTAGDRAVRDPVTASMGLVQSPPEMRGETTLALLLESADRMLYEAKAAGRNRLMSERLKLFHAAPATQSTGAVDPLERRKGNRQAA